MARMSISIPDQLRTRMSPYDDRVNWSNVAQVAFETEIDRHKLPEDMNMQDVIERLKKSKAALKPQAFELGRVAGQKWAMKSAQYVHLEAFSRLDNTVLLNVDRVGEFLLNVAFPGEDPSDTPLKNQEKGGFHDEEYILGFIRGVKQIWDEVADKL